MNIKTTAVPSECKSFYILNGEMQWISNAGFAGLFIVFAKVEGDRFTAFIIEKLRWSIYWSRGKEDGAKGIFYLFGYSRQCGGS